MIELPFFDRIMISHFLELRVEEKIIESFSFWFRLEQDNALYIQVWSKV